MEYRFSSCRGNGGQPRSASTRNRRGAPASSCWLRCVAKCPQTATLASSPAEHPGGRKRPRGPFPAFSGHLEGQARGRRAPRTTGRSGCHRRGQGSGLGHKQRLPLAAPSCATASANASKAAPFSTRASRPYRSATASPPSPSAGSGTEPRRGSVRPDSRPPTSHDASHPRRCACCLMHMLGEQRTTQQEPGMPLPSSGGTSIAGRALTHMRKMPYSIGPNGALAAADSARPRTSRVSRGSMTPSSHSRAVE
jgi:hypothetical protein